MSIKDEINNSEKTKTPTLKKHHSYCLTAIICIILIGLIVFISIVLYKNELSYLKNLLGKELVIYTAGLGTIPAIERICNTIKRFIL